MLNGSGEEVKTTKELSEKDLVILVKALKHRLPKEFE